jgi:hypothetical protein
MESAINQQGNESRPLKFNDYEVQASDSLRSIAYSQVLPPHSPGSVDACMNNILQYNDHIFKPGDHIWIPFPCDPEDGPAFLDRAARNLSGAFAGSSDLYDSAWKLSDELGIRLGTLSTANREYNYLIEKMHKQLENVPPEIGVRVGAEHWNSQTHTWDNVYVADNNYPQSAPVRIVQPGNTIESIADDRMQQLRNQGFRVNSPEYIVQFKQLNNVSTSADLQEATPVRLPY